jgi:hypothetical protein
MTDTQGRQRRDVGVTRLTRNERRKMDEKSSRPDLTPIDHMIGAHVDQVEVRQRSDGRKEIVYHRALIKGRVTPSQVMDSVLVAARMQAEQYILKMARGAPLDTKEVGALKALAEIAKTEIVTPESTTYIDVTESTDLADAKRTLWEALQSKGVE